MIPLPKTIKVGWATFDVESWPETEARDAGRAGEILFQKPLIRINDGLGQQKAAATSLLKYNQSSHCLRDLHFKGDLSYNKV